MPDVRWAALPMRKARGDFFVSFANVSRQPCLNTGSCTTKNLVNSQTRALGALCQPLVWRVQIVGVAASGSLH